jgi:hypothetical protein
MDRDADVAMDGRPARSEPDLFALSSVLRAARLRETLLAFGFGSDVPSVQELVVSGSIWMLGRKSRCWRRWPQPAHRGHERRGGQRDLVLDRGDSTAAVVAHAIATSRNARDSDTPNRVLAAATFRDVLASPAEAQLVPWLRDHDHSAKALALSGNACPLGQDKSLATRICEQEVNKVLVRSEVRN